MHRWSALLVLAVGLPQASAAQDSTATRDSVPAARPQPTVTLSLAEALETARANSPTYRQTLNDAGPARVGVRSAYGAFLPTADASAGLGYTGSGRSTFGGEVFSQSSPSYNSSYTLSLNWQLDGRVLSGPGQQKANQRAVEESISGAGVLLRTDVTTRYLDALAATAQVEVARQQVKRNDDFLQLAQARHRVGQATLLDVRQAEVTKGTSEVQLLRQLQAENEAKLQLLRTMGIVSPAPIDQIALTDSFPVTAPELQLEQLLTLAEEQNPELRALRARENAATWDLRAARSEYLPRLSVSAGWRGFTQQFTNEQMLLDQSFASARGAVDNCEFQNAIVSRLSSPLPYENGGVIANCNTFAGLTADGAALDPARAAAIRNANDVFPFSYESQPFSANLTISIPIFTGFSRSLRIAQAKAQQEDADEDVRARALQVRTDVQGRHLALQTAYQAIAVQQRNRVAAQDQLRLAQDRYRLGSGTSLELSDAQNAVQRAEGDYVTAVYDYHKAVAALEAAVGRPLR